MERLTAASVHLGGSAIIAALTALLAFRLWYPAPFADISGGAELFGIILSVDLALGPIMTFAVFDRRKALRELRLDLAVVVALQLGGLAYGLLTLFEARPAVLAVEGGHRLRVVRAVDLSDSELAKAHTEWRRLPWQGMHVVATRQLEGKETLVAVQMALEGVDVGMRPELWLPARETAQALRTSGQRLAELQKRYPDRAAELTEYVAATGRAPDELRFLPVLARRTDWVALVDERAGAIVGYAPLDGF